MAFGRGPATATDAIPATGNQKWGEDFVADASGSIATITCPQSGGGNAQKHTAVLYLTSTLARLGVSAELTVAVNAAKAPALYTISPAITGIVQGTSYRIAILSELVASPGWFYAEPVAAITVGSLVTSGNEITDALRALRQDGDARQNDSSFGIWQPSTNLVRNSGFETDLADWTFV